MAKKVFPETLHVKEEADGDVTYYVADRDMDALAEQGEAIKIATYKLVKVDSVKLVAHIYKP